MHCIQLNAWAVYNWETTSGQLSQKNFIISVAQELMEEDPDHVCLDPVVTRKVLSPAAVASTPAERFHCRREEAASIASSRKYKLVHIHTQS